MATITGRSAVHRFDTEDDWRFHKRLAQCRKNRSHYGQWHRQDSDIPYPRDNSGGWSWRDCLRDEHGWCHSIERHTSRWLREPSLGSKSGIGQMR